MSIALVTCFFNPMGYSRPIANYWRFRQALEPYPLTTVELSYNGSFSIPDSIRIEGNPHTQVLWQKERLLNHSINQLPASVQNIAWLDCDITFLNPNWIEQTEALLDQYPLVQPFTNCHWLNRNQEIEISRKSVAYAKGYARIGTGKVHPGFAWAARRELLQQWGGLFDSDITGSNDSIMASAVCHEHLRGHHDNAPDALRKRIAQWGSRVQKYLQKGNLAAVSGDVLHHYHGSIANRNYWKRFLLLKKHRFNPESDIRIAANGAWEWASPKFPLHQSVHNYFAARREDE